MLTAIINGIENKFFKRNKTIDFSTFEKVKNHINLTKTKVIKQALVLIPLSSYLFYLAAKLVIKFNDKAGSISNLALTGEIVAQTLLIMLIIFVFLPTLFTQVIKLLNTAQPINNKIKITKNENPFYQISFYDNHTSLINLLLSVNIAAFKVGENKPLQCSLKEVENLSNALLYNQMILQKQDIQTLPKKVKEKIDKNISLINNQINDTYQSINQHKLLNSKTFKATLRNNLENNLNLCKVLHEKVENAKKIKQMKEKNQEKLVQDIEKNFKENAYDFNLDIKLNDSKEQKHNKALSL
jgi:hypothetical protein